MSLIASPSDNFANISWIKITNCSTLLDYFNKMIKKNMLF